MKSKKKVFPQKEYMKNVEKLLDGKALHNEGKERFEKVITRETKKGEYTKKK